jgi:hypothetical protein
MDVHTKESQICTLAEGGSKEMAALVETLLPGASCIRNE